MSMYLFNSIAKIQAPKYIDPYNSALNSREVYPHLTTKDQDTIDECVDYIKELPITKEGRLYSQHKTALMNVNVEVAELYSSDPQYQDRVYLEVTIPTSEDNAMPDCYGYHKLVVERFIYN